MNFITNNFEMILTTLGGFFTAILTFFLGRKTRKISEQDQQASALQNMQVAYDKFTEQANKQIDRILSEMDDIKVENRDQRSAIVALQKDNSKLHVEISKLMTENNELRRMVSELKVENEILRKRQAK
jgi:uncharacterized coiled-coil DUF342 family protein